MNVNLDELYRLNDLVTKAFRRKHIIVLNPDQEYENKENLRDKTEYDKARWKMPSKKEFHILIEELSQNKELSNEEKILLIYEKLCQMYVYDDNILSFIKKKDDDSYDLPDKYGREVDEEWEKTERNIIE